MLFRSRSSANSSSPTNSRRRRSRRPLVATRAASTSAALAASAAGDDVTLLDVLPMPIGISKPDGSMQVLFPKNQPLPDYKKCTLTTSKDNQRSILLRLYQGDSKMCAENELLGTFVFSGIRPERRGKVRIEVTLHKIGRAHV